VRTAWTVSPSLAIQLVTRFPSAQLHKEVRWLLLNFPDKAVSEPEAVEVLLGETLPGDVSFQLKASSSEIRHSSLTIIVSSVLGSRKPDQRSDLLSSGLSKPSIHPSICHTSFGKSFGRCDLFLRASDCANLALRCFRLCREVYRGDCPIFSTFCSSNHLEHESKCIQGR
jgi:hypothetical protein